MLSIRLTRTGKKNDPHYRIVVQEKRSKLNGKTIDIVGHYHPAQVGKLTVIDKEKVEKWLASGAQPSDTVTNLLVKQGILKEEQKVHHFYTPAKKEEVAEAPKAEVVAEEVTKEAPVEEAAVEEPVAEEKTEEKVAEEPAAEEVPADKK